VGDRGSGRAWPPVWVSWADICGTIWCGGGLRAGLGGDGGWGVGGKNINFGRTSLSALF